jgi:hypothetical protein
MNSPSIERIIDHAKRLADPTTHPSHRLALWRLIIDAAHNGHSEELQQLEDLKSVVADPTFESLEPTI